MHGYGRSTDLLSQTCENVASVTGTIIIVQTNIHHLVFTTGQARLNPERYVIKCMGGR